ncbi:MAG TPA: class I SAM-dependent methyltransferase [Patescibacteria group bacterium]|nr:class I SAM-dependent methyltransferase [Patescibacteria group bacterium]
MSKSSKKRYQYEADFHDRWAKLIIPKEVDYKASFESVTSSENVFAYSKLSPVTGKKILDIGCGMGDASLYFASKKARVTAGDISPEMIKLVKKLAKINGFTRLILAGVVNADKLPYNDKSFDIVFGNGLLHHVDPKKALAEVYRILRPGGTAAFIEPLAHNPIINIYRTIAKKVRTDYETPLTYDLVLSFRNLKFSRFEHREFHLTTLFIFLWYFLFERKNPNEVRYWKYILKDSGRVGGVFTFLKKIDDFIVDNLPFLRRYFWNTVLVFRK